MEIEAARAVVEATPLTPAAEDHLRQRARLRSTHYSTRIEGNRLTLEQAERAITQPAFAPPGHERDVSEVRHYWQALLQIEAWAAERRPLTEELIRRLHALVEHGQRARPTPYRDGQNIIRDTASGALVYLPPEAADVPGLMAAFVAWVESQAARSLPAPIVAGLVHYQFVTIHPYFDGNGRTARLLATFILQRGGYGLNGYFSLEEHHARELGSYYAALVTHPHHNYYEGRANADLTPWLEYFLAVVSRVFTLARSEALSLAARPEPPIPAALRRLEPRARIVLGLFARVDRISAADVAAALGLSDRMARRLLQAWVADGWLIVADPSRRGRAYELSATYRPFIGHPTDTQET
jgi:Fic family protein